MKNILIILGSPDGESLGRVLARDYREAAEGAGARVRVLDLARISFDPDLTGGFRGGQVLEPDLAEAQRAMAEADHLVFVHPNWWGTYPARLKAFLDRVLTPGFAFGYKKGSRLPEQLLAGKTARLVVTMDGPSWWYRLVQGGGGDRALVRSVLGFCGVRTVGRYHADQLKPRDRAPLARHRKAAALLGRKDAA